MKKLLILSLAAATIFSSCKKGTTVPENNTPSLSGDFFPLNAGDWWEWDLYQGGTLGDYQRSEVLSEDSIYNGKTYTKCRMTSSGGENLGIFRKESNGDVYSVVLDTDPYDGVTIVESEILSIKGTYTLGDQWSYEIRSNYDSTPSDYVKNTYNHTVEQVGITHEVNGVTYNDVVKVKIDVVTESHFEMLPSNLLPPQTHIQYSYYAKGIGLIHTTVSGNIQEIILRDYNVQ